MEVEGEILGFVIIFLVISTAFYFFIIRDSGDSDEEIILPEDLDNASYGQSVDQTLVNLTEANNTLENETISNVSFESVDELHWGHMPLTYKIVNDASKCEGTPVNKMKESFDIIEKASNFRVNFTEAKGNDIVDINVTCVNRLKLLGEIEYDVTCKNVTLDSSSIQFSGYEVLTEDDYVISLNLVGRNDTVNNYRLCYVNKKTANVSFGWGLLGEAQIQINGNVIVGGEKTIYTVDSEYSYCTGFPAKEVHDAMHLLGFAHAETPVFDEDYGWFSKDVKYFKDLMFTYPFCAYLSELNNNYADCLEYIYSDGEKGTGCVGVNFVS